MESIRILTNNALKQFKTPQQFLQFYLDKLLEFDFYWNFNEKLNIKKEVNIKRTLGYAHFIQDVELDKLHDKSYQAILLEKDIVVA